MALQITVNGTTYTPTAILGYAARRASQNVVNPVINRANPDVVLRPALLRAGALECGFSGGSAEATSKAFADALAGGYIAQLTATAPDPTTVAMYFVPVDEPERALEDETRAAWIVRVPFQEVTLS